MGRHSKNQRAAERFVPLHERIYVKLRGDILKGKIKVGEKLPTEADLCTAFKSSRITIRHALESLAREQLISRSPRRGTFVVSNTPTPRPAWNVDTLRDIVQLGEHATLKVLSYSLERLSAKDAAVLQQTVAFRLQGLRRVDRKTVAFTSILLPREIGAQLKPDDFQSSTVFALLTRLGESFGAVRERIAAYPASSAVATKLGCRKGDPLLSIERLYLDERSNPLELARSWYLHDQFSIQRQIPVSDASLAQH